MTAPLTTTVRLFSSFREAVGQGQETLRTAAPTLGALRDELIARGQPWADCLARGRAVRMALDQTMAQEATPLADGAVAGCSSPTARPAAA